MKFQAIKGTRDILPPDSAAWNRVEQIAREVFESYGFGEIRLPIFEQTELFARSIGGETDVVSKEMYTFEDRRFDLQIPTDSTFLLGFLAEVEKGMQSGEIPSTKNNTMILHTLQRYAEEEQVLVKQLLSAPPSLPRPVDDEEEEDQIAIGLFTKKMSPQFNAAWQKHFAAMDGVLRMAYKLELGEMLSLRPEATASVCRAYIEHGMHTRPGNVKLYYIGPMFRRERPQKGRYRQFYQIGAEILSPPIPDAQKEIAVTATIDAEVIEMLMHFFAKVGLGKAASLQSPASSGTKLATGDSRLEAAVLYINSIGCRECRPAYVEKLRAALEKVRSKLGPDSQRRIETNPLRVLDSKLPEEQAVIETLPRITEHLCEPCKTHYAELKRQLQLRDLKCEENWRLVRGLDYYMRTTFEITAPGLGSQNAVCGGGRYDGLVRLLDGPDTKGIGFAIGTDRLMLSLAESRVESPESKDKSAPDVFIAWMGAASQPAAVKIARTLRDAGLRVEIPAEEMKFRKSLDLANRLGAHYALIIGEDEVRSGEFTLKRLSDGSQEKVSMTEIASKVASG